MAPLGLCAAAGYPFAQCVITRKHPPLTAGNVRERVEIEVEAICTALDRPGWKIGILTNYHPVGDRDPGKYRGHAHYLVCWVRVESFDLSTGTGYIVGQGGTIADVDPTWTARSKRARGIPSMARAIRDQLAESWQETGIYVQAHAGADDKDPLATIDGLVRREFRGFAGWSHIRRIGVNRRRYGILSARAWSQIRDQVISEAIHASEARDLPLPTEPAEEWGCSATEDGVRCGAPLGTVLDRGVSGGILDLATPGDAGPVVAAEALDVAALAGDVEARATLEHHREAGLLPATRRRRRTLDERIGYLQWLWADIPGVCTPFPSDADEHDDRALALGDLRGWLAHVAAHAHDVRHLGPIVAAAEALIAAADLRGERLTAWGTLAPVAIEGRDGVTRLYTGLSVRDRMRWAHAECARAVQAWRSSSSSPQRKVA